MHKWSKKKFLRIQINAKIIILEEFLKSIRIIIHTIEKYINWL